ncbi:Verlamelin biosynthesis protein B [Lachnellula suecica]|uniref:Verlamelin biosynthesis protein B n=1 Tax=Lachnellula suecica TaxID=602035 RepID=A0A8T9CI11_9HELO|nr:Verlamelin biosynthesis protein B [Lachnellula suecica]
MMEEPDYLHFQSIPWCSPLLKDPAFVVTPTFSRQPKVSTEDSLIAETFQTSKTIPFCLSLYRAPASGTTWISEVVTLMSLGTGLNGGPALLHGGVIATLMDDVIGTLLTVNKDANAMPISSTTVTASLNVSYLRSVPTPGTVLVVARCREVNGRKYQMEAEVRDGKGTVLAKADSLWIGPRSGGRL